jgi:DNA-binding IclR family transcriptional regulator
MPPRTSPTNSVQKACRILRSLSTPNKGRLTEIATATCINKATALRILEILAQEGYVRRDDATKTWSLGEEAYVIAASLTRPEDVRGQFRAQLVRLAAKSGDSVLLSIRTGMEAVCVDRELGDFPIRANYLDVGSRRPLGVGAGSLALLAWASDAEIEAILPLIKPRLSRYPKMSIRLIEQEIERSRKRGFTLVLNLLVDRMGAVGVPVLGANGQPIAALSIAALSDRIASRLDQLVAWLQEEADGSAMPARVEAKGGRARAQRKRKVAA